MTMNISRAYVLEELTEYFSLMKYKITLVNTSCIHMEGGMELLSQFGSEIITFKFLSMKFKCDEIRFLI